jgi:hypothetical protein
VSTLPRATLLALLFLLLAACASTGGRLQAAGDATVFDMALQTDLDWARVRANRQELWTIDGAPLNQLSIISKVRPGEHVFLGARERRSRPDGPWFRAGMRADEVRDVMLDALRGAGWAQVASERLRPADFGGVPGLRFELSMANGRGLRYRGMAAAAERDGRLSLLVWVAPEEHYYPRDAEAVDRMLASLRFTR